MTQKTKPITNVVPPYIDWDKIYINILHFNAHYIRFSEFVVKSILFTFSLNKMNGKKQTEASRAVHYHADD